MWALAKMGFTLNTEGVQALSHLLRTRLPSLASLQQHPPTQRTTPSSKLRSPDSPSSVQPLWQQQQQLEQQQAQGVRADSGESSQASSAPEAFPLNAQVRIRTAVRSHRHVCVCAS